MKRLFSSIVIGSLFSLSTFASDLGDFKPFAFSESGSCSDPATLSFVYLQGKMLKSVGKDSQDRTIIFNGSVAFNLKNEFRAYTEEYVWAGTQKQILKSEQVFGTTELKDYGQKQLNLTDTKGKLWGVLVINGITVDPYGKMLLLAIIDRVDASGAPLAIGAFQGKSAFGPFQETAAIYCKSPF